MVDQQIEKLDVGLAGRRIFRNYARSDLDDHRDCEGTGLRVVTNSDIDDPTDRNPSEDYSRPLRQAVDGSLEKDHGCARHLEEAEAAKDQRTSHEQSDCSQDKATNDLRICAPAHAWVLWLVRVVTSAAGSPRRRNCWTLGS